MSCGNPHDVDCAEILDRVYSFIDGELDEADCHQIQHHLDECAPCLAKDDLERVVKALVARSCRESAPEGLRSRVLYRIAEVRLEISEV